ncbi:metalloendo ase 2-MMP-like [Olea europaea subsp. europaea]|uniref:Metalloendo ase 2-MMP-like n=1 Tax=Olea europaea subsp. europaea TaxID=158383 RepID=A0A8S0UBK4_OLEEU|nr:metalloendo ase 2-MMP-like [Olea europaea subsp. europaea]
MALKISALFSFIFLLFLVLFVSCHAKKSERPNNKKPLPFDFIKQLEGCHKGEKIKGIQELKKYLEKYGYLDYHHSRNKTHENDDEFDDLLESAIKTYQFNYHINVTGVLDSETASKMMTPRCGVADIVNGTSRMRAGGMKNQYSHGKGRKSIHTVAHYSFFEGNPRWPPSSTHLTYGFSRSTPAEAREPVSKAFEKWASATHFKFSLAQNVQNANLVIGFYRGNHGDNAPFDGPGGTLAHAFAPTNGRFHYDADESWSVGAIPGRHDLETVALHEIGHLLGLGHSSVEDAIMYARIRDGEIKNLHADDIQGIRALYNV